MTFQPSQINRNALCVLKKKHNGELFIDYEKLQSPIEEAISNLENRLHRISQEDALGLYHELLKDPQLKVLFDYISSFCESLWEPFQEISKEAIHQIMHSSHRDKIAYLRTRILAYKLHYTYKLCNNNDQVLAYSHSQMGWQQFNHRINDDFSASFLTNFGFGNSTYFCTKIRYKAIDIAPLVHWVTYQFVEKNEIISCFGKYNPQNENWRKAIGDVMEACNAYWRNPVSFVEKYLLGEVQKLVNGLNMFNTRNKFTFIKSGYHFIESVSEVILEGDELISFRGNKISGSLEFIEYINSFKHIVAVSYAIQRIEELNMEYLPILEDRVEILGSLLDACERRMLGLNILHSELGEEYAYWCRVKEDLKQECYSENIYTIEEQQKRLIERNPAHEVFSKKYKSICERYSALNAEIYSFKIYLINYKKYIKTVNEYFLPK